MDSPLRITQRSIGDVIVLELSGRLVFSGEEESLLRSQITALVVGGERKLVVDLAGVDYIDSGGVGSLVTAYLHTLRRGGQLKLVCPHERVWRILRITHLNSVFELFDDQESALKSFTSSPRQSPVRS